MASIAIRSINTYASKITLNLIKYKSFPQEKFVNNVKSFHRQLSSSSVFNSSKKYSDKHEWVEVEGKIGTVGITDYAQESLGDIVYAQLPEVGAEYSQMDECGALESVKAASELFSPVTGTVTEVNANLEDQPALINQSCYEKGWLFKMELKKPEELNELMDEDAYDKFLKDQ